MGDHLENYRIHHRSRSHHVNYGDHGCQYGERLPPSGNWLGINLKNSLIKWKKIREDFEKEERY